MTDLFDLPDDLEKQADMDSIGQRNEVLQPLEQEGIVRIIGRIEPDTSINVRFLPPFRQAPRSAFFIPLYIHYFKYGSSKICPTTYGLECPACAKAWEYYDENLPGPQQHPVWKNMLAKEMYYWPVVLTDRQEDGVFLLRVPPSLHTTTLWGGFNRKQKKNITGKLRMQLQRYFEAEREKGTLPPEARNIMYLLLHPALGREVMIIRTGNTVTSTTYDAAFTDISQPCPLKDPDAVQRATQDWIRVIEEKVFYPSFPDIFNNLVEKNVKSLLKGDADEVVATVPTASPGTRSFNIPTHDNIMTTTPPPGQITQNTSGMNETPPWEDTATQNDAPPQTKPDGESSVPFDASSGDDQESDEPLKYNVTSLPEPLRPVLIRLQLIKDLSDFGAPNISLTNKYRNRILDVLVQNEEIWNKDDILEGLKSMTDMEKRSNACNEIIKGALSCL